MQFLNTCLIVSLAFNGQYCSLTIANVPCLSICKYLLWTCLIINLVNKSTTKYRILRHRYWFKENNLDFSCIFLLLGRSLTSCSNSLSCTYLISASFDLPISSVVNCEFSCFLIRCFALRLLKTRRQYAITRNNFEKLEYFSNIFHFDEKVMSMWLLYYIYL